MNCTARIATADDAGELSRLRWEFRVEDRPSQSHTEFLTKCEKWLRDALASERWVVAVAESSEGVLSGCMYLQCVDKVPIPGKIKRAWGYVTNSYVVPEKRGKGIGTKLLQMLVEEGRGRELEFLIVWPSGAAVSFYKRVGFRQTSEVLEAPDDEPPLVMIL